MKGKAVRLGIEAPADVNVLRGELAFESDKEQATARSKDLDVAVAEQAERQVPAGMASHQVSAERRRQTTKNWSVEAQSDNAICHATQTASGESFGPMAECMSTPTV
jgi:hypothetical protein